jgi:hypothetical protein
MKQFIRNILVTGLLAIGTNALMMAQTSSFAEQWYRAKFGHPSPTEQARIDDARSNTAYREVSTGPAVVPVNSWYEGWYRAKFGRPSPTEEARQQAEQSSTAYREIDAGSVAGPTNSWVDGWYRAKFGRPSPTK